MSMTDLTWEEFHIMHMELETLPMLITRYIDCFHSRGQKVDSLKAHVAVTKSAVHLKLGVVTTLVIGIVKKYYDILYYMYSLSQQH